MNPDLNSLELAKLRYADAEMRFSDAKKERDAAWAALQEAFNVAKGNKS